MPGYTAGKLPVVFGMKVVAVEALERDEAGGDLSRLRRGV
jgi:hypothetical protein